MMAYKTSKENSIHGIWNRLESHSYLDLVGMIDPERPVKQRNCHWYQYRPSASQVTTKIQQRLLLNVLNHRSKWYKKTSNVAGAGDNLLMKNSKSLQAILCYGVTEHRFYHESMAKRKVSCCWLVTATHHRPRQLISVSFWMVYGQWGRLVMTSVLLMCLCQTICRWQAFTLKLFISKERSGLYRSI